MNQLVRSTDFDPLPLLRTGLGPYEEKLLSRPLVRLEREVREWLEEHPQSAHGPVLLTQFLRQRVRDELRGLRELDESLQTFERQSTQSMTREDRAEVILQAAQALGAGPRELEQDARALDRWFDESAILDRFAARRGEAQRYVVFLLDRAGHIARRARRGTDWSAMSLERTVRSLLDERPGDAIVAAGLGALARSVREGIRRSSFRELDDDLLQRCIQLAQDDREDVWVQCSALDVLAASESDVERPGLLLALLEQRMTRPAAGDDLFVRRHVLSLAEDLLQRFPQASVIAFFGARDGSAAVRQRAAAALGSAPPDFAVNLWEKLLDDDDPAVRIAALDVAGQLAERARIAPAILSRTGARLEEEPNATVCRAGLRILADTYERLLRTTPELAQEWGRWTTALCHRLRTGSDSVEVRRDAAAAVERIWHLSDADSLAVAALLEDRLPSPGKSLRLRRSEVESYSAETWGRTLAALSQNDHGLDLERTSFGYRLHRGFRWRFRLWRFLHELRSPAPDKRQAYRHTIGRVHYGEIRAPSRVLSELAETKVPGEPLFSSLEGGWRPFLPLTDDLLTALNQPLPGRATRFYTSEGVTQLRPPRGLWGRIRAYARLQWGFVSIASLRNWNEGEGRSDAFVAHAGELGFETEFTPHDDAKLDDTVVRHFPAVLLPAGLWDRFSSYALSLYENSLFDLGLFVAAVCALFFGRHWYSNRALRRSRDQIPLAMGGWGTRGKSSVERLKAALLNAGGHAVVSKTTGCEAMLLLAPSHATLREIFLYRPYDKATIWEQANVVRLAQRLRCDTLLWECMGLTPQYVDVLQRQWMLDDLATLTNTYPDHEDIQGPAGIDIPKVMTRFIPERSLLLTSEEQMLPILAEASKERGTELRSTDWLDAARIPADLLERFPYDEHPYNVALLLRIAEALGFREDFALKEMADRVVPDLGVLKTYPRAVVSGRELRFSNGMSANERHGCLSNWGRLGLDEPPEDEWVTTVVNNRADRIPRSKVFAKILVEDLSADLHVLIGGNLTGLQGYIEEALDEWLAQLSFVDESLAPEQIFEREAGRLRVPRTADDVVRELNALCGRPRAAEAQPDRVDPRALLEQSGYSGRELDDALSFHRSEVERFELYDALRDALISDGSSPSTNTETRCREALRVWFLDRVAVVEDYHATGDQIVEFIASRTPPRRSNHVVGLQNIKGTGLDFVYRWQAWESCCDALDQLGSKDERLRDEALRFLSSFQEYGVLCEKKLRLTFDDVRRALPDTEGVFAQLDAIESRLDEALAKGTSGESEARGSTHVAARWIDALSSACENLLEAGDAVRRRKTADRIYEDLATQRISTARAAAELKQLTQRQKGGWLRKSLGAARQRPFLGRFRRSWGGAG
ncbi:MAG: hypothetical protein AAF690_13225 [Acidobacteriota bacterium]